MRACLVAGFSRTVTQLVNLAFAPTSFFATSFTAVSVASPRIVSRKYDEPNWICPRVC
jgi:hypothetical protein